MTKTIGDSFKLIEWFVFQHRVPNLYKGNEMKAVIILQRLGKKKNLFLGNVDKVDEE